MIYLDSTCNPTNTTNKTNLTANNSTGDNISIAKKTVNPKKMMIFEYVLIAVACLIVFLIIVFILCKKRTDEKKKPNEVVPEKNDNLDQSKEFKVGSEDGQNGPYSALDGNFDNT